MDIQAPDAHVFRFGIFELDTQSGELRRHGLKVRLPDQSFQILKTLIGRPGEVVTRDELRHVLWTTETFVDFEVGLNSAVRKLREALDDSAENPQFVQTLPRRGYRFVAPVNALVPSVDVSARTCRPCGCGAGGAKRSEEETSAPVVEPVLTSVARFRIARMAAGGLLLVALVAIGGCCINVENWLTRVQDRPKNRSAPSWCSRLRTSQETPHRITSPTLSPTP